MIPLSLRTTPHTLVMPNRVSGEESASSTDNRTRRSESPVPTALARLRKSKRGGLRHPANDNDERLLLRPFTPARQILLLLRRKLVDLDPHRLELQLGHALVQIIRHAVDLLLQ